MLQFVVSATSWVHYTTSCNTQSSASEDGKNNCPKHVEMSGIINKPLLLHLVDCIYYLYQWYTVKQIPDNEIYSLVKHIKSVPWTLEKRISYIEDEWCLKFKHIWYKKFIIFFHGATAPSEPGPPHHGGFKITLRHITIGMTPLNGWSALRRNSYLTTHITDERQTCMIPVRF